MMKIFRMMRYGLVPPSRGEVLPRNLLSVVLFAAVYGMIILGVVMMEWVVFTWLSAFWLMLLGLWVWWIDVCGYGGLRGWRKEVVLWMRLGLLGLFVALLAEPRMVRKDDSLSVVFLMDQSQSMRREAVEEAKRFMVKIANEKPEKDAVGVLTFGKGAAVELPPAESFMFEGEYALGVARDGTNLEKGLRLAGAVLPDDRPGKIVLVSDGVSTEGNLDGVLRQLKARDVQVDVLTVDYKYDREVLVERLEMPRAVKMGETYEAAGIIRAEKEGKGKLSLMENGRVIWQDEVEYHYGKNRYNIPIYMRNPGYYTYELTMDAGEGEDEISENNRAINYLYLQGEGRVLMVVEPGGNEQDYLSVRQALLESDRAVEVVDAFGLPDDPLAYLMYDCVMFLNVGAEHFSGAQMGAVKEAVERHGVGFVMVGGENSYGPGGYNRTLVEEILPVSMDVTQRKVLPKAALAIVLHTCEFPDGNTWGKRITKAAIKVLSQEDDIGVLVYDYQGGESWLFNLTPARNFPILAKQINGAQIGDMPSFAPTMRMAYQSLAKSDASMKHVIIISDGDPQPPSPSLLNKFMKSKISVSTVAVFPHGNSVGVMKQIANATGGRFYYPKNANLLPQIFIKEAKTLRKSMIQNKEFLPEAVYPSGVLKGIDTMPSLQGYVITTPKGRATTILEVPDSEDRDPVLSEWQFGLGKTAAFTSDLSPNWGKNWVNWDSYKAFVHQMVTNVARVKEQSNLRMQLVADGGRGLILIEDYSADSRFLEVGAKVKRPDGKDEVVKLEQVGPRRYEGEFELMGEGRYEVAVLGETGSGEEAVEEKTYGGLMVAYSQEYLRLRSNPITMEKIAQATGGEVLTGEEEVEDIFEEEREAKARSKPVFDWFLLILACMIPIDVGIRRIQIDWTVIREMIGFKKATEVSRETYSSLLSRKEGARERLYQSDSLEKARMEQQDVPDLDESNQVLVGVSGKDENDDDMGTSETMSRLAAKRREVRDAHDKG
ncbi:von Willebrand factor type A domain protein [Poriferisphaera corsica]|uniref:von Willebrand factor type A domain protein n=1 Tax=Poriferisphaera corsica TaxID=2528020 RepID=A0A517YQ70_9BACT|nr:VWA domain-containing protein [Poriferisphaera corsica]QDU32373.1 von Willebrand factor type A domain protein [Poriferisphaera corsica]